MTNLNDNKFRVPEGYFETLTERVMANIPEEKSTKKVPLRMFRWVAACVCFIVLGATAYMHFSPEQDTNPEMAALHDQDAFSQAADYTMLDNQDIYNLLAEE